jgi:DNA ligase 1
VQFVTLAATSAAVAAVSGRRAKVELLATALRGLEPGEIAAGAAYLAGDLRQRQTGVGWASLRDLPPPAEVATLTVDRVDRAVAEISVVAGGGSQGRRRELLGALFAAATADEQSMLRGLFTGELRQGAQAGLLVDAIAKAAGVDVAAVRRALLLAGDLKAVAVAALTGGATALAAFSLQVGRPLAPMLAQSASSVDEALATTGSPAVVDVKLDGIRVQVHRSGDQVAVFTRSLDEITPRVPEVVAAVRALPVREIVLDGEAIALDLAGRPRPFQETSSRAATRGARKAVAAELAKATPTEGVPAERIEGKGIPVDEGPPGTMLTPYFFDLLHLDGADLLDKPGRERWAALAAALPEALLVGRTVADEVAGAAKAFAAAVDAGHEGVVVKSPEAPYDVGRRGGAWVKVKPRHTLDLVVLAVEWGHGRRKGWLSNLHLGARDPRTGGFVMLGKTFKGLTDDVLRWQTERFLDLAVARGDWLVKVRPVQVVEVAFDGVQSSPRYPGGVALRFARVVRYRHDKTAAEADTIDMVRALHKGQKSEHGE